MCACACACVSFPLPFFDFLSSENMMCVDMIYECVCARVYLRRSEIVGDLSLTYVVTGQLVTMALFDDKPTVQYSRIGLGRGTSNCTVSKRTVSRPHETNTNLARRRQICAHLGL